VLLFVFMSAGLAEWSECRWASLVHPLTTANSDALQRTMTIHPRAKSELAYRKRARHKRKRNDESSGDVRRGK
jgi:hypothetical protein